MILEPERDAVSEQLVLSSGGHSHLLQEEVGVHLTRGSRMDVSATYVHASARENLNAYLNFYDTLMQAVVSRDEYAPAAAEVPNRLFVRGQVMPTAKWSVVGTFDWRSGLPYSIVNEDLDFVGPRNVPLPDLRADRNRRRSQNHHRPRPSLARSARGQCAGRLPPDRRPEQRRVAGVRPVLQLRIPSDSHSRPFRTLNRTPTGVFLAEIHVVRPLALCEFQH